MRNLMPKYLSRLRCAAFVLSVAVWMVGVNTGHCEIKNTVTVINSTTNWQSLKFLVSTTGLNVQMYFPPVSVIPCGSLGTNVTQISSPIWVGKSYIGLWSGSAVWPFKSVLIDFWDDGTTYQTVVFAGADLSAADSLSGTAFNSGLMFGGMMAAALFVMWMIKEVVGGHGGGDYE